MRRFAFGTALRAVVNCGTMPSIGLSVRFPVLSVVVDMPDAIKISQGECVDNEMIEGGC